MWFGGHLHSFGVRVIGRHMKFVVGTVGDYVILCLAALLYLKLKCGRFIN
jgi:hypothetical protein